MSADRKNFFEVVNIPVQLFTFNELSTQSQELALFEHANFLQSVDSIDTDYTDEYVQESIEVNEYYFYEDGTLAHTVKYVGKHELKGKSFYIHQGKQYQIN